MHHLAESDSGTATTIRRTMSITTHTATFRVTGERLASLIEAAVENRLDDVGVAARIRLIDLLDGDSKAADRMINTRVREVENDPVYRIECDRLPNPIMLAAVNANDLADQFAAYLGYHHDVACEVSIDLVQGDGRMIPSEGATSPVFVRELAPTFTVTWMTSWGRRTMKDLTADQINSRLGQNLARKAALGHEDSHRVWNVVVTDIHGTDVTAEFEVLRRTVVPFEEAHVSPDIDAAGLAAHLDRLVQRYPHLWEGTSHNGICAYRYRSSGYLIEVSTIPHLNAFMQLTEAIRRVNCIALGLPPHTPAAAVERLVRVGRGFADTPRRALREWALGEVGA
jgi:hypothetical protein